MTNSNFDIGDFNMSDNLLEKQLAEVRAELAAAKAENEADKAKIEEAKDKEFASKVEAFELKFKKKIQVLLNLKRVSKAHKLALPNLRMLSQNLKKISPLP